MKNISPETKAIGMLGLFMALIGGVIFFVSCTPAQQAKYQTDKAAVVAGLSTPQAQAIERAGAMIAQVAVDVYAPEFAWTVPLAVNAASGLIKAQNTAQTLTTVEQTINSVTAVPAYKNTVTPLIVDALRAVNPQTPAESVAATQALAQAIADHLPKK